MEHRAAVTGIGLITPLERGNGLEGFWELLVRGVDMVGPIESFDTTGYSTNVGAEIKGFKNLYGEGRWFSLIKRSFDMAFNDAGIDAVAGDPGRRGIFLGTVLGEIQRGAELWKSEVERLPYRYHLYSGAQRLANSYELRGPVMTLSTACASGADAIGMAYRAIINGRADIMIAGGGDVLSEFAFSGFNSLGAMTGTVVRPFDADRTGLAIGEGAAFLVLENMNHARKRSASIYGVVSGYDSTSDAVHMTAPDREGRGLASAMKNAIKDADLKSVDYISAHGTGTVYNDAMETQAIKKVFGAKAKEVPISSIKSMIGHSFGAVGAIEAAVCLLALNKGGIPPTINLEKPDPECDLDFVPLEARAVALNSAISLSAGFGGQNAVLVFER